ncbi:MAG: LamG domain-containing protein [Candidatus Micrarchaeota archaeon]|nr:LamG domain-containing protein [Candidatus Micrarchaeota archaeon]
MGQRLQSAMEYLMTYGWAILAIAIVMVSLYSLGIFNAGNFKPTATPGSCQIIRTAAQTSLAGQCTNMIPKYVANLNGKNSYIPTNALILPNTTTSFSFSVWVKFASTAAVNQVVLGEVGILGSQGIFALSENNGALYLGYAGCGNSNTGTNTLAPNAWHNIIANWSSSGGVGYIVVDGVREDVGGTFTLTCGSPSIASFVIGSTWKAATYFNGSISNVQLYNASLTATDIKSLYREGIGGTPINTQHLVGWWPLNGDANDYSGYYRNGNAIQVVQNANWQSGYTVPST